MYRSEKRNRLLCNSACTMYKRVVSHSQEHTPYNMSIDPGRVPWLNDGRDSLGYADYTTRVRTSKINNAAEYAFTHTHTHTHKECYNASSCPCVIFQNDYFSSALPLKRVCFFTVGPDRETTYPRLLLDLCVRVQHIIRTMRETRRLKRERRRRQPPPSHRRRCRFPSVCRRRPINPENTTTI